MHLLVFVGAAVTIAYTAMHGLGDWLLPLLGIGGGAEGTIAGSVAIALIGLLFIVMSKTPK